MYVDGTGESPEGFMTIRNYTDTITLLRKGNVGWLSLGYRLSDDEDDVEKCTGHDIIDVICYERLFADRIYIHEADGVFRGEMYNRLVSARTRNFIDNRIDIFPFSWGR